MEISVCLIVKNEEEVLDRCLNSAKQFADEIIVVDTGSCDKTKQIALKYTPLVFDYIWNDDFADARNFSFNKAGKEYVMWLDADDVITDAEIAKINLLKKQLVADTYMLKYALSFGGSANNFCYFRERIMRRDARAVWQGFIHEAIAPFGKIEYVDITIEHHKVKLANPKRNLKIYNKHIKNGEILSTRAQYYYAKELYYNGYYKSSIKELKKYLKMPGKFTPNEMDSYLTIAICYRKLQNLGLALDYLIDALKHISPSSEMLCEIGELLTEMGDFDKAIFFYKCATSVDIDYKSGQFVDKNYYYLYPYLQLTMLYYKVGEYEKSKHYHMLSKATAPENPSVKYNEQFFKNNESKNNLTS